MTKTNSQQLREGLYRLKAAIALGDSRVEISERIEALVALAVQDEPTREPVFEDLTKTLSAQVDKIQHLKNMLHLAHHLLMDQKRPTLEQEQMMRDAFAKGTIARCSCGAHEWGQDYHRIIDSDLNSHYSGRRCDLPESSPNRSVTNEEKK